MSTPRTVKHDFVPSKVYANYCGECALSQSDHFRVGPDYTDGSFTFVPSGHQNLALVACDECGAAIVDYLIPDTGDRPNQRTHTDWHQGRVEVLGGYAE